MSEHIGTHPIPSVSGYNKGCRCDGCKTAKSAYRTPDLGSRVPGIPILPPKSAVEDWKQQRACTDQDPDDFFVERGETAKTQEAKKVCAGCTVRRECLTYSVTPPREYFGVWGGLTPRERRNLTAAKLEGRPLPAIQLAPPRIGRPPRMQAAS